MGMDVYGKNPKINTKEGDFPVYEKYKNMEYKQKWNELDTEEDLTDKYFEELAKVESINKGIHLRSSVWSWRPLWNYCYAVADDIIDEVTYQKGHENSGAGLNSKDARLLGNRLLQQIREGKTIQYQASYEQYLNDLPDEDCVVCKNNNRGHRKKKECKVCKKTGKKTNFNKSYEFDIDHVKEFAEFLLECGGFEIC